MLDRLDRISARTAYLLIGLGVGASLVAAFLTPQDVEIGAYVRLVIWHGMLTTASAAVIVAMGVVAAAYLLRGSERIGEWARALQLAMLPVWVLAMGIGAISARLVWNSWNLTERRMLMGIAYTVVAAVMVIVTLSWQDRRPGAAGQIATALAMVAGLAWIALGPAGQDVHPGAAVLSSPDVAFKIAALVMFAGCVLAIAGVTVLVRGWLRKNEGVEPGTNEAVAESAD